MDHEEYMKALGTPFPSASETPRPEPIDPMTVGDLIRKLQAFPPDAVVYLTQGDCDDEVDPMPQLLDDGRVCL